MLSGTVGQCAAVRSQLLCLLCHRYRDHRICPQAALADLAVATFHRGINLEDLTKYIVAAPSMQGSQPMSGETLNVHLRQAFELAGEPVLYAAAFGRGCH